MKAALRGSYIEFVIFMGVAERYPLWFQNELYDTIYTNEDRYTFYIPLEERSPDYYEKTLVEEFSVFLRKPNGEVHVTDYDVFSDLYVTFKYDAFTNSGIAAFEEDCIEYVEFYGGTVPDGYPEWFYEFFTEAVNFPPTMDDGGTILFYDTDKCRISMQKGLVSYNASGELSVESYCVFLRNKFGEIRGLDYDEFIKHYDPEGEIIGG